MPSTNVWGVSFPVSIQWRNNQSYDLVLKRLDAGKSGIYTIYILVGEMSPGN